MISPNPATDHLIYAALGLTGTANWLLENCSDHGHSDDCCETSTSVVGVDALALTRATEPFTTYSDGRPIETRAEVDDGHIVVVQRWPADPSEMPVAEFDSEPVMLAPDAVPGDRGHAVVTWWPQGPHATVRYVAPPEPRRGLRVVG